MPPELPVLYDLQLTIKGPVADFYEIDLKLFNFGSYPPPPRRENEQIVFDRKAVLLSSSRSFLPVNLLHNSLRFYDDAERDSPSLLRLSQELLSIRMGEITRLLFQDEGVEMLRSFLQRAGALQSNSTEPKPFCRLTISIEDSRLWSIPWEWMWIRDGSQWIDIGQHLAILRRHPAHAGEHSTRFDLPLKINFKTFYPIRNFDEILEVALWRNPFIRRAYEAGGILWGESESKLNASEVQHFIFDSGESDSPWIVNFEIYRITGTDNLTEAEQRRVNIPRLLVLQDMSGSGRHFQMQHFMQRALDPGVDTVLFVRSPDFDLVSRFFSSFYGELLHNRPLDQCLLVAKQLIQNNDLSVNTMLSARQGGELSLLLSRAIIEPVETVDRLRVPTEKEHSANFTISSPPALEVVQTVHQVVETEKGHSEKVAPLFASRLAERVRQAFAGERQLMATIANRAREIRFDEENSILEAIIARREMLTASDIVNSTERLAAEIMQTGPEDRIRLTNLWLTKGKNRQGPAVARNEALVVGENYTLHLQIGQRRMEALIAESFPLEKVFEIFQMEKQIELDVMFFTPETVFRLEQRQTRLLLHRYGNTKEIAVPLVPLLIGARPIRACIYYQNILLQSILLETTVVKANEVTSGDQDAVVNTSTIDYLAPTDISAISDLPRPAINIFMNGISNGSHWIGIFSADDSHSLLRSGNLHTFATGKLSTLARQMRDRLLQVEGDNNIGFRYRSPIPGQQEMVDRENDLCTLAVEGWELFHSLFLGNEQPLEGERLRAFKKELQKQGSIISIARCRGEATTIPWASLYTLRLDTDKAGQMSLCQLFKAQLAANQWSDDQQELEEQHDLLDNPLACREQPDCPLNSNKRRQTICPFGFWGFLHQIEQPLQQIRPTPAGQIPQELHAENFVQTSFLMYSPEKALKLACGVNSDLTGATEHRQEIKELRFTPLDVDDTDDRDHVLELLEQGGWHIYYFYCHGEMQNGRFRLELGAQNKPHYLSAADLDPTEIDWPENPMPLVFINGCETMAVLPEDIHDFLSVFKQLGASGVIGTEVKVWTTLARPMARLILNYILNGKSIGEAFLEMRRHLLRRYNPLGLLYNFYSPATLHLHKPEGCDWCNKHRN
jgi:hypothetical protein